MKVILFGATGMIGSGVLTECLADPGVDVVLAAGRSAPTVAHPKLRTLVLDDLFDLRPVEERISGYDACLFCIGVSAAGMRESEYRRLTYDLTLAVAETFARISPGSVFCYVSGEGTDSSESGRLMWARVKGATENALLRLPLEVYLFRPGFVRPERGVRSKTRLYRIAYAVLDPFWPLLRRFFARHVTTTGNVGRAMLRVARDGYATRVLENTDIDAAAN